MAVLRPDYRRLSSIYLNYSMQMPRIEEMAALNTTVRTVLYIQVIIMGGIWQFN